MSRLIWVAAAFALAAGAPTAARAAVTPDYFTLPAGLTGTAGGLDVAPDGMVYFGAQTADGDQGPIGRLDASQAVPGTSSGITSVAVGDNPGVCCVGIIRDVSWSAKDGGLYFTRSDNVVGLLKDGVVSKTIMHLNTAPWGIAAAPNGGAWFSENGADNSANWFGNRIAFVTPAMGVTETTNLAFQDGRTTVDPLRYDAGPRGMAVAADGLPWFVEDDVGNPGYRIATWDGAKYTEYFPTKCAASGPCSGAFTGNGLQDVTVASDGTLWYTDQFTRAVGHLVPGGDVTEYPLAGMGLGAATPGPGTIKRAVDGTLWFTVNGGYGSALNSVVQINPTDLTKTVYPLGAALQPFEVAPDTKGNVWVTGSPQTAAGAWIARLNGVVGPAPTPPGGGGTPVTPISQPTPTPTGTQLTGGVTTTAQISKPTVNGDSISANQICVGPPQDRCSLIYLIQTHEYVTGFPGVKGSAAKVKTFTIGKKTVTLKGGQKSKVTVKLNKLGKKLFKKKKKFKATLTVTQSVKGSKKPKTVLKKNVTFKR